jgi:hypothetical protein
MIPFKRGENPLSSEEEKMLGEWWRNEFLTKKASKLKPVWSWNGKYDLLKDALFLCNNDHCAYCDCHPLKDDRGFEIDHFKPKTKFPLEAFTYFNLFPCCNECNKKGIGYHILLVILVNTSKSEENQKRAFKTIEIFRLNIGNKPRNRITAIKKEIECNTPFDERPYRYGY